MILEVIIALDLKAVKHVQVLEDTWTTEGTEQHRDGLHAAVATLLDITVGFKILVVIATMVSDLHDGAFQQLLLHNPTPAWTTASLLGLQQIH